MDIQGRFIRKDAVDTRVYQTNIAQTCLKGSTLVVLPTGLGKTVIALIVVDKVLERTEEEATKGGGKVLILAPTRPLVEQHKDFFERFLENVPVAAFTGDLSPKERQAIWKRTRVVVSTPQVIQNDVLTGRYDLNGVALAIFDEAHRARGNYSYVHVYELYRKHRKAVNRPVLSMGTTASPGSTLEAILDVCQNLGLGLTEVRTEEDEDVAPYVHDINSHWRVVDLPPEQKEVVKALMNIRDRLLAPLMDAGFIERSVNVSTRSILTARDRIQGAIERCRRLGPSGIGSNTEDEVSCLIRLSMVQSQLMTVVHAVELAETQGPEPLKSFLGRLRERTTSGTWSRSTDDLLHDSAMQAVLALVQDLQGHHPKVRSVKDVLVDQFSVKKDSRVIVFAHFRDTAEVLIRELMTLQGVRPCRFVGQSSRGEDKGLTQREQSVILKKFRSGAVNVLVATSVAEEGLDIPSTDMVVLYEPVASEIRAIQRRGRTGRAMTGRVELMMTRGTKDEACYWAARSKEKRMRSEIGHLKVGLKDVASTSHVPASNRALPMAGPARIPSTSVDAKIDELPFPWARTEPCDGLHKEKPSDTAGPSNEPSITVDHREVPTPVAMELNRLGARIEAEQLEVGDYILSDRVVIERKTTRDFLDSLIDGRLFEQLSRLRSVYSRPILVIEGEDIQSDRNLNPTAIDGALASIMVDFGVPIMRTRDACETASVLVKIAKREHAQRRSVAVRRSKPRCELRTKLRLVIEGLPNISSTLSERLLVHFRTIRNIMNASVEELQEVRGVGPLTAVAIFQMVRACFNETEMARQDHEFERSVDQRPAVTGQGQDTKER